MASLPRGPLFLVLIWFGARQGTGQLNFQSWISWKTTEVARNCGILDVTDRHWLVIKGCECGLNEVRRSGFFFFCVCVCVYVCVCVWLKAEP